MPGDTNATPWHQDSPKWPMNEDGCMSIWIALDDVDENNGCMMFVPKSHKVGKLTNISLHDPVNIFDFVQGTPLADRKPVMVPLKAGSCTFHDGLTFHYAHANKTDKPRRAYAIIYMPDGTTYNGNLTWFRMGSHVRLRNRCAGLCSRCLPKHLLKDDPSDTGGDMPVHWRNVRLNKLTSSKPISCAISIILSSVCTNSRLAAMIRMSLRYSRNVRPVFALNLALKVETLIPHSRLTSASLSCFSR